MNNISKRLLSLLNNRQNNVLITLFNHLYYESKNPIIIAELLNENNTIILHSFNKTASALFDLHKSNLSYSYDLESYFLDQSDLDCVINKIKLYHLKKQNIGYFDIKTILKLPMNDVNFYIIKIMSLIDNDVQLIMLNINVPEKPTFNKVSNSKRNSIIVMNQKNQFCYTNQETQTLFGFDPNNVSEIEPYILDGIDCFKIQLESLFDENSQITIKNRQLKLINCISNDEKKCIVNAKYSKVNNNLIYIIYYIIPLPPLHFNNIKFCSVNQKSVIPISNNKLPHISIYGRYNQQ